MGLAGVSLSEGMSPRTIAYQFDLSLACFFDRKWISIFNACSKVLQCEESLVWTLSRMVLGGSQADLQGITCTYRND